MNATKHGLTAAMYFANRKEVREFKRVKDQLTKEWQPSGTAEEYCIETMAHSIVRSGRVMQAEAGEIRKLTPSRFERECNDEERLNQVFLDLQSGEPSKSNSHRNYQKSKDLHRTTAGISYLMEILVVLESAVQADSVTADLIRTFLQFFPVAPRSPAAELLAAMGDPDLRELVLSEKLVLTPERKEATLKLLEREIDLLAGRCVAAADLEDDRYQAEELAALVPSESTTGKLMRYESHHQRTFQKALNQLRELQADRHRQAATARQQVPVPAHSSKEQS